MSENRMSSRGLSWTPTFDDVLGMGYHGLISLECAASMHGLCSFMGETCVEILVPSETPGRCIDGSVVTLEVSEIDTEDARQVADNLWLAAPEQSVIDMIRYDSPEEFILQALSNEGVMNLVTNSLMLDSEKLNTLAEKYHVSDKLNEYRTHVSDLWEE